MFLRKGRGGDWGGGRRFRVVFLIYLFIIIFLEVRGPTLCLCGWMRVSLSLRKRRPTGVLEEDKLLARCEIRAMMWNPWHDWDGGKITRRRASQDTRGKKIETNIYICIHIYKSLLLLRRLRAAVRSEGWWAALTRICSDLCSSGLTL